MKQIRNLFHAFLAVSILFAVVSCDENNIGPDKSKTSILPENFKVDIPSSISKNNYAASFKSTESESDTLNGNEVYENLTYFIALGEESADIVESILWYLHIYNIDNIIELTYVSEDDNRIKHMSVVEGGIYQERNWEYTLTITDVDSESNDDGGIAMQLFWDNDPTEGIALLKPYNINRLEDEELGDAVFSIEYSEAGMGEYDAYMIIQVANIPLPDAEFDQYAVDNLKMFVGKKGDIIDVYGNSNHPNAQFYTENTGFNWAFIASGNEKENISVAEISLPPCSLDSHERDVILKEYSIKNVLTTEINQWFIDEFGIRPHEEDLANYLKNADAPGFFDEAGFIQGGTAPSADYDVLMNRLEALSPYNPSEVNNLTISLE